MVVGILLAGGVGKRMGANVPKQFLEVNGKPIIWYPLTVMENHPDIDAVEIVCVESFMDDMWNIVNQYGFKKVRWIIPGGGTCQESSRNGVLNLKGILADSDIILIQMTSYPLAGTDILSDCIKSAKLNGNGCTARAIQYSVYFTDDRRTSVEQMDRDKLKLCTMPFAFQFGECAALYERAYAEGHGIEGNVFTNTLYCDYGKRIYFTKDSEMNLKITTPEDIRLMQAVLMVMEQNGETDFIEGEENRGKISGWHR